MIELTTEQYVAVLAAERLAGREEVLSVLVRRSAIERASRDGEGCATRGEHIHACRVLEETLRACNATETGEAS